MSTQQRNTLRETGRLVRDVPPELARQLDEVRRAPGHQVHQDRGNLLLLGPPQQMMVQELNGLMVETWKYLDRTLTFQNGVLQS